MPLFQTAPPLQKNGGLPHWTLVQIRMYFVYFSDRNIHNDHPLRSQEQPSPRFIINWLFE